MQLKPETGEDDEAELLTRRPGAQPGGSAGLNVVVRDRPGSALREFGTLAWFLQRGQSVVEGADLDQFEAVGLVTWLPDSFPPGREHGGALVGGRARLVGDATDLADVAVGVDGSGARDEFSAVQRPGVSLSMTASVIIRPADGPPMSPTLKVIFRFGSALRSSG